MEYYGGTGGFIHCDWKLLYRMGGWFDERGRHRRDRRLSNLDEIREHVSA